MPLLLGSAVSDNTSDLTEAVNNLLATLTSHSIRGWNFTSGVVARTTGSDFQFSIAYETGGASIGTPYTFRIFDGRTLAEAMGQATAFIVGTPGAWTSTPIVLSLTDSRKVRRFIVGMMVNASLANGAANWTPQGGGATVASVFGRTGTIIAQAGDYTVAQVTNAATAGSNSNITALTGLLTPLSVAQGGTGANTAAGARANLALRSAAEGRFEVEDFLNGASGLYLGLAASNNFGTATALATATGDRIGILQCRTGTGGQASRRAGVAQSLVSTILGGGAENMFVFGAAAASALADGTNTGFLWLGLSTQAGAEGADSVGIRSTNGGNWVVYCRASNTETSFDTGLAASLGDYYDFSFWVSAAADEVVFYNGQNVLTSITTNIPTSAMGLRAIVLGAAASAVNIGMDVDYVGHGRKYANARWVVR